MCPVHGSPNRLACIAVPQGTEHIRPAARYRYSAGQRLMLLDRGACVDGVVEAWAGALRGNEHRLTILPKLRGQLVAGGEEEGGVDLDLNECNHTVQRFASVAEYEGGRATYCTTLRDEFETVEDGITGNVLRLALTWID